MTTPPKFPLRLLRWFCDPELLEDVEGDLSELYRARAAKNIRVANWLYAIDVLLLFRPGIVRRFQWFNPVNNINMFINHIKTAVRQAGRFKGYTSINIAGLVVGLASCMLILLWVADELAKDQFHEKRDRLYQVWRNLQDRGALSTTSGIPFPLEHVLRTQYPEVESVTSYSWQQEFLFRVGETSSFEKGHFVTPEFFDVFSYKLLAGDRNKVLNGAATTAVISDRMALKFFGNDWRENAIGQSIRVDEITDIEVVGVFETPGEDSSMKFEWLMSAKDYIARNEWIDSWFNGGFSMFFTLKPGADTEAVRARLEKEVIRNTNNSSKEPLYMQLYSENYLHGTFKNGAPVGGRIQYVRILSAIAIFILLLACINFTNLATARASLRAREIGVRKVMGAVRSTLSQQFFVEAMLYAIVSTTVASMIAILVLPYFNTLTGKSIDIDFSNPLLWTTILSIVGLTAMLSGVYPAFMLSSLPVARSLKGRTKSGGAPFRHGLVTFQFAISIFLISGTIVISKQLHYILNKDIGLKRDNLVSVQLDGELYKKREVYLSTLRNIPEVRSVTACNSNPTNFGISSGGANWPGKDPNLQLEVNVLTVDENFTKTMGMQIVRGEDFTNVYLRDSARFLINETLAGVMGFEEPVGQQLSLWGTTGVIAGVVKDFHMASMYSPILPLVIRCQPKGTNRAFIRIDENINDALMHIERVSKEINPAFPFRYDFLDEDFGRQYRAEQSVSSLVNIFAAVSIFIACLGLLGLSSFSADQRAKEIGVRKVHGASVRSLVLLLSRQYAMLMIVAFVIAGPLSYFYTQRWLSDFAYRTDVNPLLFVLAGLITFAIGALTVSYKSYAAALANPVKTLKEE